MEKSDYYVQDNADIEAKKFDAAKGLYQSGDYANALRLYLDMQNASTSYKLYYEIGRCYYRLNDMTNAELYFSRSVALDNTKNPSYVFLGNIFYKKNDLSTAIENWMRSYSYKPDDEAVCLNLATSYFSKNMKFYSIHYYEKYLKYAKDKTSSAYSEIKNSIEEFIRIGNDFYKKAQKAVTVGENDTAIQGLEYAVANFPTNFDINYLLGKLYYEKTDYKRALTYLQQAFCLDSRSLDILQKLSSVMLNLEDYSGAYCCFKRMLPLVLKHQQEYLELIKTVSQIERMSDKFDFSKREVQAQKYYADNNYYMALFEYENCVILNPELNESLGETISRLKLFLNPEERIIKTCFDKGATYYSTGDFKQSNRYFSKIMSLANESSSEYKLARSRLVNV